MSDNKRKCVEQQKTVGKMTLTKRVALLELCMRDVMEWQDRHTKVRCSDCRKEAVYDVVTRDGLRLRACEDHRATWLGAKVTRRKIK